jgi:hypothetical protein
MDGIKADHPPGGKGRYTGRQLMGKAGDLEQSIHPVCYG